jgi:hypothetical protein
MSEHVISSSTSPVEKENAMPVRPVQSPTVAVPKPVEKTVIPKAFRESKTGTRVDGFQGVSPQTVSSPGLPASAVRAVSLDAQPPVTFENVIKFLDTRDPFQGTTQRFALDRLERIMPDALKQKFVEDIASVMNDEIFWSHDNSFLSDAAYYVQNPDSPMVSTFKFAPGSQEVFRQAFLNLEQGLKNTAPDVLADFSACFRGQKLIELNPDQPTFQHSAVGRPWGVFVPDPIEPPAVDPGTQPQAPDTVDGLGQVFDGLQVVLDIVGFIPGVGEVADATNAGISVLRGDFLGAALSALSLIPVAGDALGKGAKYLLKAAENPATKNAAAGAAKQFMDLVAKTDFSSFKKSLKDALGKVPNVGSKVDEVLAGIDRGLDEALTKISEAFGIPKPAFASLGNAGEDAGRFTPAQLGSSAEFVAKRTASLTNFVKTTYNKMKVPAEFKNLAGFAEIQLANKVKALFETSARGNGHLLVHALEEDTLNRVGRLATGLAARSGDFGLFANNDVARQAAIAVLDDLAKAGGKAFDKGSMAELTKDLAVGQAKALANGLTVIKKQVDGIVSYEVTKTFGFQTGLAASLNGAELVSKACNAVRVVINGDFLTTVFPLLVR